MDWSHLKVVLAIHRSGSLTRAAIQLATDQTTVGRRLSALEEQLGSKLFLRAKSGFLPTEKGLIVIDHARTVERNVEEMLDAISDADDGASGVVRLMANSWMLERLAVTVLPNLLAEHPNLELRLSGRLPPAPLHGEATISLWFDAPPHPTEVSIPLLRLPYAPYRSRAIGSDLDAWVQFLDDDAVGPSFSRQTKRKITKTAKIRLTATDAQILKIAVCAGIGNAVLPVCLGEPEDELERIPNYQGIERVLHVHLNPDTAKTRRVQTVLKALKHGGPAALFGHALRSKHELLPD